MRIGVMCMVLSMTGYGRDVFRCSDIQATVEVRTVNHRFFDFSPKIPRSIIYLEDEMKKIAAASFGRGRIEVFIDLKGSGLTKRSLEVDWELMDQYMSHMSEMKKRYTLSGDVPIASIASHPDLMMIQEEDLHTNQLGEGLLAAVRNACERAYVMRKEEGTFLQADIEKRMKNIKDMVLLIEELRTRVIEEYRARIHARIEDYIAGQSNLDEGRLQQEIAILAEKGDITEEITRLKSHLDHFSETLARGEAIGRTLDFILQEMHREANTIGSKSSDKSIGKLTVQLKSDLEKVKEQIQNIE